MAYENGAASEQGVTFQIQPLPDFRAPTHWTYFQLDAFHPSSPNPIGYLRVAFISRQTGKAMNQERLLLLQIKGHPVYPFPETRALKRVDYQDPATWEGWKKDPKGAARYVMETAMHYSYSAWNRELAERDNQGLIELVEQNRPHLNRATQDQLEQEFAFGVNKADVDYIHLEEDWRSKGLAQAMYAAMVAFLDREHGITLNASTTQTPEAQRAWERMAAKGWVSTDVKGRRFISYGVSASTLENRDVAPTPVPQPKPTRGRRGPR